MGFFSRFTRPAWEKAAERAKKSAAAGDHGVAARLFNDAIAKAPDEEKPTLTQARLKSATIVYEANVAEGKTRSSAGQVSRAIEHFELAKEFAPDAAAGDACETEIKRLTAERRAGEAVEGEPAFVDEDLALDDDQTYGVLVGAFPDEVADAYEDRDAAFRGAFMAMHRGDVEQALEVFQAQASDDDAVAWLEVGRCTRGLERFADAEAAFARAEEIAPTWNHVRLLAAESCLAAGNVEGAEEVLQRAIDFDDEDPMVYRAICRTAIASNAPGYGLEAAEAGLEIAPMDRALRLYQSRLHELAGNHELAIAGYEKRVQETWRYDAQEGKLFLDYDAAMFAAHLYRRLGKEPARAAELFRGLLAMSPPEARWQHELGLADVLKCGGKDVEADAILTDLKRSIPEAQRLAHCRVASLLGEPLAPLLETLSDDERAAWEASELQREGR